jgi:cation transport regulator ChaB
MPYSINAELPKGVKEHLPEEAQTIYRKASSLIFFMLNFS